MTAPTLDIIAERIGTDPAALLSDEVLGWGCALDDVSLERLRKRLSETVKARDLQAFVRAIKARRNEQKEERKRERNQPDNRPQIVITVDEGHVNDQAAEALGDIPGLYSRMGEIVRVVEVKRRLPGEETLYTSNEIRIVSEPLLREMFARCARWIEPAEDPGDGALAKPAHPPEWSVKAVKARHDWPNLAPLYHVAESPLLITGGRIIARRGYDPCMGILCETKICVEVQSDPAHDEAKAAAAKLMELVSQVPFESEAHRSAWLAALLTPIARWAFKGCCPLFMFDANREGTGKGFLIGIIGGIVLGRIIDTTTQTADEDEERKFITSKVLTAQPIVLIDECDKPFGSGPLQGVLTTGMWAPRLLGTNDSPSYPASIVWFAAGNNVQLKSGDIARRTCFVRIVTSLDNPAERVGFKIEDMDAHVIEHRAELFSAALTLLRAWIQTGIVASSLKGWGGRWGGFNNWDQVVRGAIVWAGYADPIEAKATRAGTALREGVSDIVLGLEEAIAKHGEHGEISAATLATVLADDDANRKAMPGWSAPAPAFAMFRRGIAAAAPHLKGQTPNVNQLGIWLGKTKAQPVPSPTGRKWIRSRNCSGLLWRVELVPAEATPVDTSDPDDETKGPADERYIDEERAAMQGDLPPE